MVQKKFFCNLFLIFSLFLVCPQVFAQKKYSPEQEQGFEAYRKNDWTSAMFFLRKVGATAQGFDADTLYMLVMSEINCGEYDSALVDANVFLSKFESSFYAPYMQFQKGKVLHLLNKNEDSVLVLSDFCHQNQDSDLYPTALYWIAECFYAEYNFDSARALYQRVVEDFPASEKVLDSKYRIEMIAQREREEKLIYLLKVTGEENLAAREDYEKQLRLLQTEDKMGLRKALSEAESKINSLQNQLDSEKAKNAALASQNEGLLNQSNSGIQIIPSTNDNSASQMENIVTGFSDSRNAVDPEVEALKKKARQLQYVLDQQRAENAE